MTDKILLNGMEFFGHHGCSEEERKIGQIFKVDAELIFDLSIAGKSDEISDTVDYVQVFEEIKRIVEGEPKKLIESVIETIAEKVLEKFPLIETIKLTLYKPAAPIADTFQGAAVLIVRSRTLK